MAKVTAVIDIGSNSARMAIFRRTSRFGFYLVEEARSRVRISEGCYENGGILQEIPMQRALCALKEFREIAKRHGARKLFCVATSAVRDAPNSREFIRRAKRESGVAIRVIGGEKEAFYGAISALNLLPYKEGITIDIGGGSTECALLVDGKVRELVSLKLGTIRLKELFFDRCVSYKDALAFVQKELECLPQSFRSTRVFGIGGTLRALSKTIMKAVEYPIDTVHGFSYDVAEWLEFFTKIYTSESGKLKTLGIKEDRLDTIQGGVLIFASLLKLFGAKEVVTSGVGVREGVFLEDLLRSQRGVFPPNFNPSVRSLLDRFSLNPGAAQRVKKIALELFDALLVRHRLDTGYRYHLGIAAKLSNIGSALSYYDHHHHGSYFILESLTYAISHQDRAIIALLVEYHNKKIPKDSAIAHLSSLMPPLLTLQWLSFLLALAQSLALSPCEYAFTYQDGMLMIAPSGDSYLAQEGVMKLDKPAPIVFCFKTEERA